MFKNPVVINSEEHGRLRFTPANNLSFARGISHAPVLAYELEEMAKYFPIVFETASGLPMVIFGLLKGSNLYLTDEDRWRVSVMPAALSCYPFGILREEGGSYLMIMDESAETLQATRGKLLYNKKGENLRPSPMLKGLKSRLEAIERQRLISNTAFASLSEHGVLAEHEASFKIGDDSHRFGGFSVIDWEKVQQVDSTVRDQWERSGMMQLLQAQTESLKNFHLLHGLHQHAR